jgi:hypothetical protein
MFVERGKNAYWLHKHTCEVYKSGFILYLIPYHSTAIYV